MTVPTVVNSIAKHGEFHLAGCFQNRGTPKSSILIEFPL